MSWRSLVVVERLKVCGERLELLDCVVHNVESRKEIRVYRSLLSSRGCLRQEPSHSESDDIE